VQMHQARTLRQLFVTDRAVAEALVQPDVGGTLRAGEQRQRGHLGAGEVLDGSKKPSADPTSLVVRRDGEPTYVQNLLALEAADAAHHAWPQQRYEPTAGEYFVGELFEGLGQRRQERVAIALRLTQVGRALHGQHLTGVLEAGMTDQHGPHDVQIYDAGDTEQAW
jgi:hypothetical protein